MRHYILIFNSFTATYYFAFRDEDDPMDRYYVAEDIPQFEDENKAKLMLSALNTSFIAKEYR